MALTIGSVSYADPATGMMGTSNKYWLKALKPDAPQYRIAAITAPGVEGRAECRMGFDCRRLGSLEVVYVYNAANTCMTTYETDVGTLKNTSVTVVAHGNTFASCRVTRMEVIKGPLFTSQNSMYRMHVLIELEQQRET